MDFKEEILQRTNEILLTSNVKEKNILARKLAGFVKNGDVIGFGSGTTSILAVQEIAKRMLNEKLDITAVPTSNEIERFCKYYNIKTKKLNDVKLDWAFDGADEVDVHNNMIKGKGAAMFREKLNILCSPLTYILVDNSKFVDRLCKKCPIPIECYQGSIIYVQQELEKLEVESYKIREKDGKPVITDSNNYIIDATFNSKLVNKKLEKNLKAITGVIETGLFMQYKNIKILK